MSSSLREQKRGGHIGLMGTTGLAAALALGYAALGILQLRGWSLVSTGIPVLVLLLVCIGIAFSAILARLPAEIGRRWRALRSSGRDK